MLDLAVQDQKVSWLQLTIDTVKNADVIDDDRVGYFFQKACFVGTSVAKDHLKHLVLETKGLSLWFRHCPHLVTNGPLEPVFSSPPTRC